MLQKTITYTRALTLTVPDDSMSNEELVALVDGAAYRELDDRGITVVDDETSNFASCTTNI